MLDLLSGKQGYHAFCKAAGFGWIPGGDFKKCSGHDLIKKDDWITRGGTLNKDHALARRSTYDEINSGQLWLSSNIKYALAIYFSRSMGANIFPFQQVKAASIKNQNLFWVAQFLGHPANCDVVDSYYNSAKGQLNSLEAPELEQRILDWESGKTMSAIPKLIFTPPVTKLRLVPPAGG